MSLPKIIIFETIEELINSIYQTNFEKEKGIEITDKIIISELSNNKLKVILIKKSNGEFGLVLAFLTSKKNGSWNKIYPYEEQIKNFPKIFEKYLEINNINKKIWSKRYEN